MLLDPNSVAGIRLYLEDGLSGLHQLVKDRARLAKANELRWLDGFLLFGRIFLDESAQVQRVTEGYGDTGHGIPNVADVLPSNLLAEVLPHLTYSRTFCILAPPDKQCPVCGSTWDIKTATDVVEYRDELMHTMCARLVDERDTHDQYRALLDKTPFASFPVAYVENGYWKTDSPWVSVKTPWGAVVMGWRKRVINIDWSDTKCDVGDDAFDGEETTKGPYGIHAWSTTKAIEYLTKVHALLVLTPRQDPPTTQR